MDSDWLLNEPDASESTEDLLALLTGDLLASSWWSPIDDDFVLCDSSLSSEESESVPTAAPHNPPKKKVRKKPSRRPKDEIASLRRTVEDLENVLLLRNRRRAAPKNSSPSLSSGRSVSVWRGVAMRQLQLLRESQHENHRLRDEVQQQLAMLTRLRRLARRIRAPVETIPPIVAPVHTTIFANKERELQVMASGVFASLNFISAKLSSRLQQEEFCDSVLYGGRATRTRGIRAESSVGRLVPRDGSCLAQALWEQLALNDRVNERNYRVEYVDQESNSYVVWFSVSFPTPYGLAVYHGAGVRARKIDPRRVSIVTVASMWPHASTPSPFNAVGFNATIVTIFQPHEEASEATESVGEVLMHNVFSPLEYVSSMTREQASTLEDFMIKARDHTVDETQNLLDSVMLKRI